jgi:hypothetical protein
MNVRINDEHNTKILSKDRLVIVIFLFVSGSSITRHTTVTDPVFI